MSEDKKPPYSVSKAWGVSQWKRVTYGFIPKRLIFKTWLYCHLLKKYIRIEKKTRDETWML